MRMIIARSRNRQRFVERDRALRDPIGQRRTFHQLQHQRAHAVGILQAVDAADVGGFSAASVFASRWKRATRSGSATNSSGRTLIATSRSSFVSRAR